MPRGFGGQSQQRWGDNTVNQNEYMRDVQMLDTSGRVCATGDVRRKGMMILLAFFHRDSAETEKLLTTLQRLADAYKDSNKLTVWGVSPDDADTTAAFAKALGVKFPILLDRDGYHAMTYGLTTFPTVYLADAGGTVQRKSTGFREAILNEISAKVAGVAGVDAVDLFAPAIEPTPAAA
jgi:peroxiredoxin